jgi:SAM-dependent methyltransferase
MFRLEAAWLAQRLAGYSAEALSPVLNLGSSTEDFRCRAQPWIDELIFAPLRRRKVEVIHCDLKQAPGVDLTHNILEDEGFAALKALKPRTVLLCNILEHVLEPGLLTRRALDVLQPGGRLIVTVPRSYPHHRDPIDTMFRPTPEDVATFVPEAILEHAAILPTGNHWDDIFAKPRKIQSKRFKWLFTPYKVSFAVLLKPMDQPAAEPVAV